MAEEEESSLTLPLLARAAVRRLTKGYKVGERIHSRRDAR